MRSRLPLVVMMLAIASLLVLSSCATSVSVSYMNPSEIDMGRHRTVALTSTVPFEGFHGPGRYVRAVDSMAAAYSRIPSSYDRALADDVAKEATAKLASALASTGFFQIVSPTVSDRLVSRSRAGMQIDDEVQELGIDAFIVPRIVSMDVNEYVSSEREYYYDHSRVDRDGDPLRLVRYRYYLTQTVSIVYSYTVIDASTMTIYATKSFSDKREFVNEVSSRFFSGPRVMRYFDAMLDDITSIAASQLAPQRRQVSIDLMDNRPKLKGVEEAYDLVRDGAVSAARDIFERGWMEDGHLPSGYNYALLCAVGGDIDGAIGILEDVSASYADEDVQALLDRLRTLSRRNQEALEQIRGEGAPVSYVDGSASVFTMVMGD